MSETTGNMKLHGMWASPWVRRVKIGLEIKGISYEYFEEDLKNKSELLLKYNPVKKLVPVLVHDGRPIPESLIILEYIDQMWSNAPKLFPNENAYLLAKVRFWAKFIDLQLFERLRDIVKCPNDNEEQKIIKEIQGSMAKLEANVHELYNKKEDSISNKENMEILDILMITLLPIIEGVQEAIDVRFIDAGKYPLSFSWMKAYDGLQVVTETAPDHEKLVNFLKKLRQFFRRNAL